ncbi:hypothetical protein WJX72_000153 [[Myrmecia] bisecta]|uniref:Luc7-like protein 3 n=1 Tax=[Myrmecia] bisecta TaxID=41462 RepID=A0AAW1PFH4_9CHLO
MDAVRAMLDELMGPNRDDPHKPKVKRNLSDKDVCPFYLCGLCPYEEFDKTKHEMGACPLVHDDDCKAQWEALPDKQRDRLGHERELQKFLDRLVGDLQKKIKRNEERLAADKKQLLLPDDQAAVQAVTEQIRDMLAQAESLGEQGQVDAAQACTQQAEALKVQKAQMEAEGYVRAGNANNRYGMQEVCPLSGVIINREETRVRDHKMGRNYRAWVNAHDKLKELQATFKRRQEEREKERAGVSGRRPADSSQDANAARQPSGSSWRPERLGQGQASRAIHPRKEDAVGHAPGIAATGRTANEKMVEQPHRTNDQAV